MYEKLGRGGGERGLAEADCVFSFLFFAPNESIMGNVCVRMCTFVLGIIPVSGLTFEIDLHHFWPSLAILVALVHPATILPLLEARRARQYILFTF